MAGQQHACTTLGTVSAAQPLVAFGVLSRAKAFNRRSLIRSTWGGSALLGRGRPSLLRFIVAFDDKYRKVVQEQNDHRDIYLVTGNSEGAWYAGKVLSWLRHAIRLYRPLFVATVDDDAFVVVHRVVSDLGQIHASGERHVVYSAFEWFAYQRNTGNYDAWGG